jgi:PIN domain nuclease of toxin-antitoxin system
MRFLIDTHVLIWFVNNDSQLSERASTLISNPANDILVSTASLWEMGDQIQPRQTRFAARLRGIRGDSTARQRFRDLLIQTSHLAEVVRLPFHDRDPFDRLIIAQSLAENIRSSAPTRLRYLRHRRIWS